MKELKRKIKNRGLKISWVAQQLNISQPALSMYLNEQRQMPIEIELRIKKLLK